MSFAKLVLFVDGVGYSLAARSRDDMFIKNVHFVVLTFENHFQTCAKTTIFINIAPI